MTSRLTWYAEIRPFVTSIRCSFTQAEVMFRIVFEARLSATWIASSKLFSDFAVISLTLATDAAMSSSRGGLATCTPGEQPGPEILLCGLRSQESSTRRRVEVPGHRTLNWRDRSRTQRIRKTGPRVRLSVAGDQVLACCSKCFRSSGAERDRGGRLRDLE